MARSVAITDTCDECDWIGLEGVIAVVRHVIAIDGPPKKFDLCPQHDHAFQPYIHLYKERGASEEDQPRRQKALASPQKAESKEKPSSKKSGNKEPGKEKSAREKLYVVCTEKHPMSDGGHKRVSYTGRGSHADIVHDGKKLWDIKWEDPDGVLTAPCRVHKECMETGLAFSSQKGLGAHMAACPLEQVTQRT
ncbi:hypothetical protein [Streptomyces tubercidicus]|uniref:hypothetical protein n=1 Tax=Streptomyces tubercidicus TaxID=47759 RepID=UPI0036925EE0